MFFDALFQEVHEIPQHSYIIAEIRTRAKLRDENIRPVAGRKRMWSDYRMRHTRRNHGYRMRHQPIAPVQLLAGNNDDRRACAIREKMCVRPIVHARNGCHSWL